MGMFLNHKPKLATPEDVRNVFKMRKKVVVVEDEEPKTLNEMLKQSKKSVCETPTSPDSGQVTGGEDSNVENAETVNDEEVPEMALLMSDEGEDDIDEDSGNNAKKSENNAGGQPDCEDISSDEEWV